MTFWAGLEAFAGAPALIPEEGASLTYAALAERADRFAASIREMLPASVRRPLVLVETANEVDPIAAYLGSLRAGWPLILAAEGATAQDDRIRATYRPNIIFRRRGTAFRADVDSTAALPMHADLAIMLSTSGTTGAPKLVRLSGRNLAANAEQIAEYLAIGADERAIATLSFHYSYGMSVLNTHLLRGAALVLTARSVAEEAFWDAFSRHRATSLALVPFQFDLLESRSFESRRLSSLRTITQAGGRLSEALIRRYAALGQRDGWALYVMYGQTEAGPRMAYVPPGDLLDNADAIGRPVPGGRFELIGADGRPIEGAGVPGELVYTGPNVMMGYATEAAHLALPQGPARLATGDLAERKTNGLYRIVGRISRFVKLYGLRISLDEIEQRLRGEGLAAYAVGGDTGITVFLSGPAQPEAVGSHLRASLGLPPSALRAESLAEVPLLSTGKVDYRGLAERAKALAGERAAPGGDIEAIVADALRTSAIDPSKSFAELGGDSLAYMEVQLALTERLGAVPDGWETLPVAELAALAPRPAPRLQRVPADLLLRVLALSAVIALHATSLPIAGGAHLLLVLAGFSLARFQRARLFAGEVGEMLATMLLPILAGYYLILSGVSLLIAPVDPQWLVLAGNFDPDIHPPGITPYWFVCLYAQVLVLVALPFAAPPLRAPIAAHPLLAGAALTVLLASASSAAGLADALTVPPLRHPLFALQLLAVGWCAFHARTALEKAAVASLAALASLPFWDAGPMVLAMLLGGTFALLWVRGLPVPASIARLALIFGGSSMGIYLAHVIVISALARIELRPEGLVFLPTLAGSLAIALLSSRVVRLSLRAWQDLQRRWQGA